MKISQLVKLLKEAEERFGDLDVFSQADWEYVNQVAVDQKYPDLGVDNDLMVILLWARDPQLELWIMEE